MISVEVRKLMPEDFDCFKIERMEAVIRAAINKFRELDRFSDKTGFFFPKDPTIDSGNVPVEIFVWILSRGANMGRQLRQGLSKEISFDFRAEMCQWRSLAGVAVVVLALDEHDGFTALSGIAKKGKD